MSIEQQEGFRSQEEAQAAADFEKQQNPIPETVTPDKNAEVTDPEEPTVDSDEKKREEERRQRIEEEKRKILQEKISELFEELDKLSSEDINSLANSGRLENGSPIRGEAIGQFDDDQASRLAKAFLEGLEISLIF
jgi:hypothetical protein